MHFKIWGSRGSIPAPLTPKDVEEKIHTTLELFSNSQFFANKDIETFLKRSLLSNRSTFGANTTCVEISQNNQSLIIDGGSGLRLKGLELMKGDCGKGKGEVHILMTHFHWDHLMGIPFFIPIFVPGNNIHFYSPDPMLGEAIQMVFTKPYFPVPFSALGAQVHFHHLDLYKKKQLGEFAVTSFKLDHPDPCFGYKIEAQGKSYAHVVDNEAKRIGRNALAEDLPLYQNIDLMYFDAQYGFDDMLKKVDWGHASSFLGMDIAFREKIRKIIFTHHDPMASDKALEQMIVVNHEYYKSQAKDYDSQFEWDFAYDGMECEI